MLIQMSEELRNTKQELITMRTRQLETEKELNDTREILSIGNVIISEIEVEIRKILTHWSWLVNIQCKTCWSLMANIN